jgi:dolichol-phosphate mannosyltransferase
MTERPSVAIVLPVYNEGAVVADLVRRMPPERDDVFVVDDGSTDQGPDLAREAGATVLSHGRRRGVGAAIRSGLSAARERGHSYVVVMAGNGKDDPAEIPRVLEPLHDGYDYVQGSRFLRGGAYRNLPAGRHLLMRGYTLLFRLLTGFPLTDVTNGFRAYRLALLDDPRIRLDQEWLDGYELEYYLHYKVLTLGYRVREVAVSKNYLAGKRDYSKVRPIVDWWRGLRPVLFLALRMKR